MTKFHLRHLLTFSEGVLRATTETKRVIRRMAALLLFTVVAVLICATLMYLFERHAEDSDIGDRFGLAVYWSASQLLTLGSALDNPVTTPGRILAVFMDVYAVVVIGTISGSLGAYFLHRIDVRLAAERHHRGKTAPVAPADGPAPDGATDPAAVASADGGPDTPQPSETGREPSAAG